MKFSCLQENISQGLNICSHLVSSNRVSLPILNNILLTTQKGYLKLSVTNLETAIETKIRAKIEKEGQITIPSQILNNYIELLPNEVLNFELIKKELIIKSKKQTAKIKGISAEEFPIIPQIETKEKFTINSDILKNVLEKTLFAISSSEIRIELSGALFSFNDPDLNKLSIVGTDSYRLTEKQVDLKKISFKNNKKIIIPIKTLQEVLRIIKNKDEVEICLSENQILFIYQNTELISRIIDGEYPDYKQTIPEIIKTNVIVKKDEFLRIIKTTGFFTKIGINDVSLKFISKENKIIISSLNNQIGEIKATISADIKGENNEIIFNYRYLIDGLTNLPGDEIKVEIVNDDTPAVIRSVSDKSYLYLIMPIKNN
ncbi:MAG: DNA polymerase III subunit beta [Patescibacteria group bacterium]|jgi:DNA polymerase-3 subunit beta|nr:DNA polymerase III subunit beta [Patescibacteria group bacterium]MDD5172769.1 DNA polymerase III subunit beta [Patescibacteria group bacterium]